MIRQLLLILLLGSASFVQGQTFEMLNGDTINYTDEQGNKQGYWYTYYPTGEVLSECYYVNDKKFDTEIKYHKKPHCIQEITSYENDLMDGPRTIYYPDCKIKAEESYKKGLKHGSFRSFHQKGWLMTNALFDNGKLIGSVAYYDESGGLKYESGEYTIDFQVSFDKFLSNDYKLRDSTIFRIMERNKEFNRMLVVSDATGSMFAYMAELLLWYRTQTEKDLVKYWVFFNDGDVKLDNLKTIGNTGGVYGFSAGDFKQLKKDLESVIRNGTGGDEPENNMEALIVATNKYRDYEDLVMIADNHSKVRDLALLKKFKKPVHIIVCGAHDGINTDYLQIARKTGGSVHTEFSDIKNLQTLQEGETIQIEGILYQLKENNRFVRLSPPANKSGQR